MMLQPLEGEGIGGVASTPGDDGEEVEAESGGQVVGMKCRAPLTEVRCVFWSECEAKGTTTWTCREESNNVLRYYIFVLQSWGSVNYHNAMVLCVEPQDEEQEDVKVIKPYPG